jgi:hypothetical protein
MVGPSNPAGVCIASRLGLRPARHNTQDDRYKWGL